MNEIHLNEIIFNAGILGCGGAGFPTHAKLGSGVKHLLLNGAECEPLLRTDRYIMIHEAEKVVKAASITRKFLGNIPCTIALKKAYTEEIIALEKAINEIDSDINIHKMQSFYPVGDEQVIVAQVTGSAVPPAGIPLDVGCVVSNVTTMHSIAMALENASPFTEKYLTVTGMVKNPTVMKVPVGTSFMECINLAGGVTNEDYVVVSGGPMMGKYITKAEMLNSFVSKTTSGILILPKEGKIGKSALPLTQIKHRAKSACIQCSFCTQFCPRNLLGHPIEPHRIMRKLAMCDNIENLLDDPDIKNALLCCECGICEQFACPMDLQPRKINAYIKKELAKAQIRYTKGEGAREISPYRDDRFIPTKRIAARAGVSEFYSSCTTDKLEVYTPSFVSLSLRMSIGASSEVIVKQSSYVTKGQLIAKCPDGKLGTNLHASISGYVNIFDDCITITSEEAKQQ